jgi:tetratricopeptide (TPR) repeat protein
MWSNVLDRISYWSLFLVITLLPIFFLPFSQISIETTKGLLLVIGLAIAIIFWALARFSDGTITFPKSSLITAGLLVVLVTLLSSIFSASPAMSFFGTMFDVGTFWFILSAFLLMIFSSIIFGNRAHARVLLLGVIASFGIVLVFQALRFYFPGALSLGVLGNKLGNLVGSWNTLGIYAGLSALVTLFVLEFFTISPIGKWLLAVLMSLSLLIVAAVNFTFVWILLGIFALIIFVYKTSFMAAANRSEGHKVPFPAFSFAVVMVALLFFTSGDSIRQYIPAQFGLSNTEIGPSFQGTYVATKEVIKQSPVLGSGPNTFSQAWSLYKLPAVNSTAFWNVSFNAGSGLLPTLITTTGILGILAWVLFLILFLIIGLRSIFGSLKQGFNPEMAIFFIAALYLLISAFFYFTGGAMFLLALAFAGIFVGLVSTNAESPKMISWHFLNDHRKSFIFILAVVLLVIITAAGSFRYVARFTSIPYFQKAIAAQSVPDAEASIKKAVSLYPNDLYLRTYAQIYLAKLNTIVAKGSSITDADKKDLQATLSQAVNSGVLATQFNPKNYLNYMVLGGVYSTGASLGVTDAYDKAVESYNMAASLNPGNPSIQLALARVSIIAKKNKEAKDFVNKALALKPNYIDALIAMSQIARSEGNSHDAVSYAEKALALSPTNETLIKYVNTLKSGATAKTPEDIDSGDQN